MLTIRPSTVNGRCDAPPSKSYTHRAFALALLSEGATLVREPLLSEDPLATLACVEKLGAKAERRDDGVLVHGGALVAPDDVLDCRNSGTTMRLLTAVAALAPGGAVLTGDATLRRRPMQPLLDALRPLGVEAWSTRANGLPPVVVRGPMEGGATTIPGDVSSQYVSALVLAGARAPRGLDLQVTTPLKSRPYVDITLDMLRRFGARAEVEEGAGGRGPRFRVPGGQRFACAEYRVPGDFSSAAFPLGAAAVTRGTVTVGNLDLANPQGDKAIVDALRAFGCKATETRDSVTLTGGELRGIAWDLGDTPDMFPLLCAVAAHAKGETVLHNAKHLRFKESDRIAAMTRELRKMGVDIEEREDGAVVRGGRVKSGATVDTYGDHRILMACAVAALAADGPTRIADTESHAVSYPAFLDDFRRMGAAFEVEEGAP